jgi:chemotaxis signal transduction protein
MILGRRLESPLEGAEMSATDKRQPQDEASNRPNPETEERPTEDAADEEARPEEQLYFCLGKEEYAVSLSSVLEIRRVERLTRVPRAVRYARGVMNLRGSIVPILDLGELLGRGLIAVDSRSRIVVVSWEQRSIGLLVEEIVGIFQIDRREIQSGTVESATGRHPVLIDLDQVLKSSLPLAKTE